jgi:integrase
LIDARLRFCGTRKRFYVATAARKAALEAMARALTDAEIDARRATAILTDGASADAAGFEALEKLVAELASGEGGARPRAQLGATFRELAEQWVKGELHDRWPDHVKKKKSVDDDKGRLDVLYVTIGGVRLEAFTLDDAERAMASLDRSLSSATRRQYAQLISKVLKLAVYPCKIIERSPLPVGFLPKVKNTKATAYLYPDEDAALLKCQGDDEKPGVPLVRRVLYGFLAREGLRLGEALALRWADLDLERGTVNLDKNKTDDPRFWVLAPGVAAALRRFKAEGVKPTAAVFAGIDEPHMADCFRNDLGAAGVTRAELFDRTPTRLPIRVHDLRATFVTLSLAAGRSETWVADRTGHKSSAMINRYRRAARTAAELGLGELRPLDQAIPELAGKRPGPEGGPGKRPSSRKPAAGVKKTSLVDAGAEGRGRTDTLLLETDFESAASANSATSASSGPTIVKSGHPWLVKSARPGRQTLTC